MVEHVGHTYYTIPRQLPSQISVDSSRTQVKNAPIPHDCAEYKFWVLQGAPCNKEEAEKPGFGMRRSGVERGRRSQRSGIDMTSGPGAGSLSSLLLVIFGLVFQLFLLPIVKDLKFSSCSFLSFFQLFLLPNAR
jgi:hypothetical protein